MRRLRHLSLEAIQILSVAALAGIPYFFWIGQGYAAELTDRSVTISTATPSASANDSFNITIPSAQPVGSIVFQDCANSPKFLESCSPPAGLDVSGAVLAAQSGNSGFSIDAADSSPNEIVIGRPAVPTTAQPSSYIFNNITNPSTNNVTTYVRISTYASSDGSGSYIDNGAVAFSTSTTFEVGAYIPPYLNLCVGVIVADNCADATDNNL